MRRMAVGLLAGLALLSEARAQTAAALYDSAAVAWEAGDYVAALERFDRILAGSAGAPFVERIALITGEAVHTSAITADGRAARWSPDGGYAAYETGAPGPQTRTHVLRIERGAIRPVVELEGHALAFSRSGVAYLTLPNTPEIRAARREADSLARARDFAAARRRIAEIARREAETARIVVREWSGRTLGRERELPAPRLLKQGLVYVPGSDRLILIASRADGDAATSDLYTLAPGAAPRALTSGPGRKAIAAVAAGMVVYTIGTDRFAVYDASRDHHRPFSGDSPALSADGSTLVFLARGTAGDTTTITVVALRDTAAPPSVVVRTRDRVANPALSPDGRRVVYQRMPREDWELFVLDADGSNERRLTRDIQHDLFPRFLTADRILAVMGEARHRRSYLYDVTTGERRRLFHNNTVRTVAPEYAWAASPDGSGVLIVADRDGDTVSPERGVYHTNLGRPVTVAELRERIAAGLAGERRLRAAAESTFAPLREPIGAATADVSVDRIYGYAKDLFAFDSKFITQPGNRLAIEYLRRTLASFGYEPELQWFEPRPGLRSANVIATLRGSVSPDVVYVVSSHFDSVEPGPGADDNSSGTTALLEAARVLARRPQAATIQFAFFTGEEAGLLGSREYVRRAQAGGVRIAGALNNDMIGYANDQRLDNTIRYSNAGIRDIQHGAAMLFTDLITYDSRYYQNTDAAAYYEAYGDIVGGIGSYPILGNPHYHQPHDVLETINQRLVAEVSRTTVATIMLLASTPARPTGLTRAAASADSLTVEWAPAPERDIVGYRVAWGPPEDPLRHSTRVQHPRARLPRAAANAIISVKAVNGRGRESWDWARLRE